MQTELIIEQHIHGGFGVDFNKCGVEDILYVSEELILRGIGGFFPTLVTDSVENLKRQIDIIKQAKTQQTNSGAEIIGIHLEGNFINPEKKGIHNPKHFLEPNVDNYRLIEDDFIKIVTLAPELDEGLTDYLKEKGVKVQAGHCVGSDLSKCDGATHLFNAMSGINHRIPSTALSALVDDNIYTEIIADGIHLSDDIIKLILKSKPTDKVLLISDALPITYSDLKETIFADEKIFYDGDRATSKEGTIAGSTKLIPEIIKIMGLKGLFNPEFIDNSYNYHNLNSFGSIEWDEEYNVVSVTKYIK